MSDSESDDDFLSADEGEAEEQNSSDLPVHTGYDDEKKSEIDGPQCSGAEQTETEKKEVENDKEIGVTDVTGLGLAKTEAGHKKNEVESEAKVSDSKEEFQAGIASVAPVENTAENFEQSTDCLITPERDNIEDTSQDNSDKQMVGKQTKNTNIETTSEKPNDKKSKIFEDSETNDIAHLKNQQQEKQRSGKPNENDAEDQQKHAKKNKEIKSDDSQEELKKSSSRNDDIDVSAGEKIEDEQPHVINEDKEHEELSDVLFVNEPKRLEEQTSIIATFDNQTEMPEEMVNEVNEVETKPPNKGNENAAEMKDVQKVDKRVSGDKKSSDGAGKAKCNVKEQDSSNEQGDNESVVSSPSKEEEESVTHELVIEDEVEKMVPTKENENTMSESEIPNGENQASQSTKTTESASTDPAKESVDNAADTAKEEEWGWDSWADDFILQTASKVSTLLETVEGHLGIPDPKEMAQTLKKGESNDDETAQDNEMKKQEEEADDSTISSAPTPTSSAGTTSSWFSSFVPVTALTNLVQSTGSELVSGGIDALEFIGKKTVDILAEGDPGLRGKREGLVGNKSTLSSVLQEARISNEKVERSNTAIKGDDPAKFQDMFEKFQGVAHLDALEMLSSECDGKLERILNVQSEDAKDESTEMLSNVKKHFDLSEDDDEKEESDVDFKKEIYLISKKLKLKVTCSKLLNTWSKLKERSANLDIENVHECFESAVSALAEFTSRCVEYYRKVAEMLIMTDMDAKSLAVVRASALKKITELYENEVSVLTNSYSKYLADKKKEDASRIVTDIYLEGSNCASLLRDSHALVLPILQLSAIK